MTGKWQYLRRHLLVLPYAIKIVTPKIAHHRLHDDILGHRPKCTLACVGNFLLAMCRYGDTGMTDYVPSRERA